MTSSTDKKGKRRALVAAPSASDRIKLQSHLESMGCDVTAVHDEEICASLMARGDFQVAILVHDPEEMNTLDIIQAKPELCLNCNVILLALNSSIEDAVCAMQAGAKDFITFPDDLDNMGFVLDTAINFRKKEVQTVSGKAKKSTKTDESSIHNGSEFKKHQILTCSPVMKNLLEQASSVAKSKATVLVQGESGTGKELLARFIHQQSNRAKGPFVALNCAALPETLLESELFGHEKGAFSGAIARKAGKFELADGGTLLLDEVTEMALPLQAKLLRVLQEGEVDRLGGSAPVPVDVRVVATTNRDVLAAVRGGQFREDLYFRLNVIPLKLPSLRERAEDIAFLAVHFRNFFTEEYGKQGLEFTEGVLHSLSQLKWNGNIRELRNVVERGVLLASGKSIKMSDLLGEEYAGDEIEANESVEKKNDEEVFNLGDLEKEMVKKALCKTEGNRTHAAKLLGISVRTLRNKLAEYRRMGLVL